MIRTLREDDFDAIHQAFVEAFSDYVVPMRRGWVPELSSGIFEDERLVAFTLNGFDGVNGYDTGSGVIPTHRRRGLARQTMEHSIELLGTPAFRIALGSSRRAGSIAGLWSAVAVKSGGCGHRTP